MIYGSTANNLGRPALKGRIKKHNEQDCLLRKHSNLKNRTIVVHILSQNIRCKKEYILCSLNYSFCPDICIYVGGGLTGPRT